MFQTFSQIDDSASYLRVMGESAMVRCRRDLLDWLQGNLQTLLPHDVLLAGWGSFESGALDYHVLPTSGDALHDDAAEMLPFVLNRLHDAWNRGGRTAARDNFGSVTALLGGDCLASPLIGGLGRMKSALVHGLRDERSGQDCLYVLLSRNEVAPGKTEAAMAILLPCIDLAARQVNDLPLQTSRARLPASPAVSDANDLSDRETQIMAWVAAGKTNSEIGSILGISGFTVKNHMQRIFRKLDVFNRAQAVSKITRVGLDG